MLALLLPVLALHWLLSAAVHDLTENWRELTPMPPRMTAVYVRELKPAAPALSTRHRNAPARPPAAAAAPRTAQLAESEAPPAVLEAEPAASAVPLEAPLALPPALAPDLAGPDAEPGPEWPASTRLSYALTGNYRGAVTGQAQVEWLREGRRYQVHLDLSVGPGFAPLIARRMSSEGLLGPRGIAPQRYDEETRILFADRRRASVLFQGERLTLADGHQEPAPPGAQDASSQFVQLTWLFLTGREPMVAGHIVELPLVLPRRQYLWRYEVLGEEVLRTPLGELVTWHLRPTKASSTAAGAGDLSAEVWLAPSLQYLPVRLLIRQDERTYIDLMLNSPPVQAAP